MQNSWELNFSRFKLLPSISQFIWLTIGDSFKHFDVESQMKHKFIKRNCESFIVVRVMNSRVKATAPQHLFEMRLQAS